jgi:hypothetical protein
MRRRFLIALLAFGTLAGYSSGVASLYRWHRYGSPYAGYGGHCRHWQGPSSPADAPAEPGPR